MKAINELIFDQTAHYSVEHTWAKLEGELVTIGISDFAQSHLDEIVYVELPNVGDRYNINDMFGVVESVKTASDLFIPVGGEVIEVNTELENAPDLINQNPFVNGWMVRIKPSDIKEWQGLLSADAYAANIKEQM